MAKGKKTVYFCQNCGHEEAKWLGQCPMCKEWNTFVEERIDSGITKGTTVAAERRMKRKWFQSQKFPRMMIQGIRLELKN